MQASSTRTMLWQSIGRNLAVSTVPKGARIFVDGKESGPSRPTASCRFWPMEAIPYNWPVKTTPYGRAPSRSRKADGPVPLSVTLAVNTYVFSQKNGGPESKFFKLPGLSPSTKRTISTSPDESSTYRIKKFDRDGGFRASWGDAGRETKIFEHAGRHRRGRRGQRLCHGYPGMLAS